MLAKAVLSALSLAAVVLADCASNPDPVAISCLQADNRNGNQNCNPDDISCLCKDYVTDGNAQVWNGHCVMDSCQDSGNLDQGVSAVVAAQSSICASYTASSTSSTAVSTTSPYPTSTTTVGSQVTSTVIVTGTGTPISSALPTVTATLPGTVTTLISSITPDPTIIFTSVVTAITYSS